MTWQAPSPISVSTPLLESTEQTSVVRVSNVQLMVLLGGGGIGETTRGCTILTVPLIAVVVGLYPPHSISIGSPSGSWMLTVAVAASPSPTSAVTSAL